MLEMNRSAVLNAIPMVDNKLLQSDDWMKNLSLTTLVKKYSDSLSTMHNPSADIELKEFAEGQMIRAKAYLSLFHAAMCKGVDVSDEDAPYQIYCLLRGEASRPNAEDVYKYCTDKAKAGLKVFKSGLNKGAGWVIKHTQDKIK